jgi:peptidoglycan/xylan/chitin deacetylase (PgdA/CDA1 family)/CelD/BcsL family acetyltransferase involved in cellulose biosynthesis
MKVVEIRHEAEFEQLQGGWDRLVSESGAPNIFLTWEWASAWWSAYGTPGELRLFTFLDESGALRGIAPLRQQTIRKYGQSISTLCFVGDGSYDSDYLDFITAAGYEKQVMEAFRAHLQEELKRGLVLLLNEIPETSPHLPLLQELAESRQLAWKTGDVPCATVRLSDNWDDYMQTLQSRFRTKVRSVLRNLEGRPEVRFYFCDDPNQLERLLPTLFDLHTRRWAEEGKPGVFGGDKKRDFYFRISRLLLARKRLRLSWVEWNGRILACQYGFVYGDVYNQLQEGYEPASEHWNLGIGLRAWSIRELLKEGVREYDFLGGVGRHKTCWGATVKHSKRIQVAARSYRNLLFRRGPEWEAAGREWIVKAVPEKVLAMRKARLGQHAGTNGDSASWFRQTAAVCYSNSGLPALTRRLRDRYQVSIGAQGLRNVSWKKRQHGSARILYYHRVNDDKDRFFGAISTDLFEHHMRYIARHYRVLSIGDLIDHLEEGDSAEPVIAITFDDGYEDNYRNAFPILRRYGLPATIFLTTGSIDSGEPLWFERLAAAVKATSKESIDLEIDIPRRLWMRNETERLQAHEQIFAVMRLMKDHDRRDRLEEVLRQLGSPIASNSGNHMLSWDQIRLMKANGIDFGGHTVSHPFLSKVTPEEARWEVSECKRRIEEELQQPAEFFAYPNGREEDFAAFNKELLRAAGYRAAMTTIWGVNDRSTDRMELRRGGPWEAHPAMFAYKLDWYQWANQ